MDTKLFGFPEVVGIKERDKRGSTGSDACVSSGAEATIRFVDELDLGMASGELGNDLLREIGRPVIDDINPADWISLGKCRLDGRCDELLAVVNGSVIKFV